MEGSGTLKIYVAAPWVERELASKVAALLTEKGHTVTHNWWDHDVPGMEEEKLAECAGQDYEAVYNADKFILLNTQKMGAESTGKAVETGLALAWGIPVIMVGKWTNIFHLMPQVTRVESLGAMLEELSK